MNDQANRNNGGLVPEGRRALAPVAPTNPLVSRGLADLAQGRSLKGTEPIRSDLRDAFFYYDRGMGWLEKKNHDNAAKDFDEAIRLFDEAIRLDPNNVSAHIHRGHAWLGKMQTDCSNDDIIEGDHRANSDFDKAVKDFDEAIRLNPRRPYHYTIRAKAWMKIKDYDHAIKDYDEAIRLYPKGAFFYLDRANAWMKIKDYDNAIKDYDEAIRLCPKVTFYYLCRGDAWMKIKDYDQAIKDYDEAIRLCPNYAVAYSSRALAWLAKNDDDKAITDYDEAIRLDPKNARCYSGRAFAWSGKKDYAKAITDYAEAIRLDPKNAFLKKLREDALKSLAGNSLVVRLFEKSNGLPVIRGTVHNDTGKTVERLKLSIRTAGWERVYEVRTSVPNNTTQSFSIYVGEAIDVESFEVLRK